MVLMSQQTFVEKEHREGTKEKHRVSGRSHDVQDSTRDSLTSGDFEREKRRKWRTSEVPTPSKYFLAYTHSTCFWTQNGGTQPCCSEMMHVPVGKHCHMYVPIFINKPPIVSKSSETAGKPSMLTIAALKTQRRYSFAFRRRHQTSTQVEPDLFSLHLLRSNSSTAFDEIVIREGLIAYFTRQE